MSRTKGALNKSKAVPAKTEKKPIIKQSKISKYTTAELSVHLAKRGYVLKPMKDVFEENMKVELKKYLVPEERCVETGYVEETSPNKVPLARLQVIFSQASSSVDRLRENIISLENKARNLFGYDVEVAEPKSEETRHASEAFAVLDETRSTLMNRLAKVTMAIAEFVG